MQSCGHQKSPRNYCWNALTALGNIVSAVLHQCKRLEVPMCQVRVRILCSDFCAFDLKVASDSTLAANVGENGSETYWPSSFENSAMHQDQKTPPETSASNDSFSLTLILSDFFACSACCRANPSALLRCFLTSASSQSGSEGPDIKAG